MNQHFSIIGGFTLHVSLYLPLAVKIPKIGIEQTTSSTTGRAFNLDTTRFSKSLHKTWIITSDWACFIQLTKNPA
jgi:hypothetical protein